MLDHDPKMKSKNKKQQSAFCLLFYYLRVFQEHVTIKHRLQWQENTLMRKGTDMTRQMSFLSLTFYFLVVVSASVLTAAPALAGPNFLPHFHLPRINGSKAVRALAYPVTKTVVNGGKTILKAGATADSLGLVPNIGPPAVSRVVKKTLWGFGRH